MWLEALILPLLGAFIYRMRGGMPPSLPRPIDQMLFAFPYAVVTYLYWDNVFVALLIWAITTAAVAKGHGNSMDLGDFDRNPEYYEFLIKWLKPHIPLYWYDALGLAISGLTYTLPAGIVTLNPMLAFSGALKAPAYMLGKKAGGGTESGELLTGAALWASFI